MNKKQIDIFFKIVDAEFRQDARAILTGAAARSIIGSNSPSMDIDFAIDLKNHSEQNWKQLESAIRKAIDKTGIQVDYAEDIDRWGMITLLDYKNHTKLYKKIGKLAIRVLNPAYWSIGKITRFINPDILDMIHVFRKTGIQPSKLAKIWGKALKASPRSTAIALFRRHVEDFFRSYGKKIWGPGFNPAKAVKQFHESAGITE